MQKLSLEELYTNGSAEIIVGKKFLNIVSAEYTHFNLFMLKCQGFKSMKYYVIESRKRANVLIRKLNNYVLGVKKLCFKGNFFHPYFEIIIDEENFLESGIEGELGIARVEPKNDLEITIKEPRYLY
ncbi:MAG: hypothetical protein PHT91_03490 [Candidatus Nanoarchaeia archaeon]|nr:hypothetical protein [Candidatus Nanoarchaeia archaeon]